VLFGQPELDETLAKPSLRQLRDRITHTFRTRPFGAGDIAKYLSFRMRAAGYRGPEVFTARAVANITKASDGLSRRINILADKSLLAAYTENTHAITAKHVRAAVADSEFAASRGRPRAAFFYLAAALAAGAALGAAAQWALAPSAPPPAPPAVSPKAAVRAAPAVPAAPAQLAEAAPEPAKPEPKPAPQPEPQLTPEQAQRIAGYSPGGQPLLAERLAATREALERAGDERYALELFITENTEPARMEDFLQRARKLVALEDLFVIPVAGGGDYRLWVVYGDFASREEAAKASQGLPARYQQAFRAAPRSFAELRRPL
jgi:septal ring-binding cell division protein DamX